MEILSQRRQVLGTEVEIRLPAPNSSLFSHCFEELNRIEKKYSRFLEDSQISRMNKTLGKWQYVDDETLLLFSKALEFEKNTHSNFDITLKSELDAMGYGKGLSFRKNPELPDRIFEGIFSSLLPKIDLDMGKKRILLRREADFGGFGKGYAIDRVAQMLEEAKVARYCINAGGDIFAKSAHGQEPWVILLEHPDDETRAIGKINIANGAIAASASNKRKWGNGIHHLLNARTRKPANGAKASFVYAKTATDADAYATAVFCAGFENGIDLAKTLPIELLLVSNENRMYKSGGFEAEFFQ